MARTIPIAPRQPEQSQNTVNTESRSIVISTYLFSIAFDVLAADSRHTHSDVNVCDATATDRLEYGTLPTNQTTYN